MSIKPTLDAASVLAAARRGVAAFDPGPHPRKILLASLGFPLADPAVRAALLDLHRRGEIVLVRVDLPGGCRLSLIGRGQPSSLLDESEIVDGEARYHAVLVAGEDSQGDSR